MKKLKLFSLALMALCSMSLFADNFQTGFESGSAWGGSNTSNRSLSTDAKRTGSKGLYGTGSSGSGRRFTSPAITTEADTKYYAICWVKSSVTATAGVGIGGAASTYPFDCAANTWTRIYVDYTQGSKSSTKTINPTFTISGSATFYVDDVVFYATTMNEVDLTAPSSATDANATTTGISWTKGSDAGTGIASTLLWKRTGGSSNDLTLNDQGMYSHTSSGRGPSTDQSGHWTLVDSIGPNVESTSGIFSEGECYAIVHYDMAYNYSTPTYVTIQAATAYDATFANGGHGVAPSKAEGVSFVVLEEITGVDGWIHTGWKADVATQKGTTDIPANTLIENGETIVLLGNTTFTAQWQQISESPTITTQPSTSAVEYPRGETADALSVEATGAGTLSYQWYSNTEAATTGENLVEIDGATNANYTPSTTTLGTLYYFCAVTNTEEGKAPTTINSELSGAITVVTNPLGEHTLTWTVRVENSETTITTTDKNPTSIHLESMSDIAINGALTVDNTGKNGGTGKIKPTNGDKVATNYLSMTFTVAEGYTFTPTTYTMSTTAVSTAKTVEVEISDTHGHSKSATWNQSKSASEPDSHNYDLSGSAYEGVVTLKIYVYNDKNDQEEDVNNGYRLGSSIVLAGTVAAIDYNVNFAKGEGSGEMEPLVKHIGDEVELPACTFTAPDGYAFAAWTSTDVTITDNKFTMPASNVTITATYAQLYAITCAVAENGTVTADKAQAIAGETVTLTLVPDPGYKVTSVKVNDGEPLVVSDNKATFTMPDAAANVVATFSVATALDNTEADAKAVKRLENGMLVIEKNGVRYNAQGQIVR